MKKSIRKHHYHSFWKRGLYFLGITILIMGGGTAGFHLIERFGWMDSFYFASLIATGQGVPPSITTVTSLGKFFTCGFAFISAGSMVASLGFLFGPFLGSLFRIGVIKLEEEFHFGKSDDKS